MKLKLLLIACLLTAIGVSQILGPSRCPTGYTWNGSTCVPSGRDGPTSPITLPPIFPPFTPNPIGCPPGYRRNGQACVPINSNECRSG